MEKLEVINNRLQENYGTFDGNLPHWRVVWSTDETEKRLVEYTNEGFQLLTPEIREMPKYNYAKDRWILEKCIPVPTYHENALTTKLTYEPIWVFEDAQHFPLPYNWVAIELIISTVYNAARQSIGAKYKDPESDPEEAIEAKRKRITELEQALYGNESNIGDALAHNQAVVVPTSYEGKQ